MSRRSNEITRVSIIVTCKGRLKHLKQTLPSFLSQKVNKNIDYEVIVCDYNCPDRTFDWCAKQGVKCVKVTDNSNIFNLSRALNIAAAFSHADVLVKIDADQIVEPTWLQTMLNGLKGREIINAAVYGEAVKIGDTDMYFFPEKNGKPSSVSFAVNREMWSLVRGLDEAFEGWGYEDADFVNRVLLSIKGVIKYVPFKGKFINHGEEDSVRFYKEKDKQKSAKRNLDRLESKRLINPNGFGVTLNYLLTGVSVAQAWSDNYSKTQTPGPYGVEFSYLKAAEFLDGLRVEDWGGGMGWAKNYIDKCTCIDGSGPFADKIADLETYTSSTEGILIRHVFEHCWNWKQILQNALNSFKKRMIVVLFIPTNNSLRALPQYKEKLLNVPNLSLPKKPFEETLKTAKCAFDSEVLETGETIYYINR